ncbi:Uncharacterised protein [Vibrio cholerae]|nr:Uncharacterised protein [Vibrio cholerae]
MDSNQPAKLQDYKRSGNGQTQDRYLFLLDYSL